MDLVELTEEIVKSLVVDKEAVSVKEFDSEDEEKNFSDAKKYLANLIKNLNGKIDDNDVPF